MTFSKNILDKLHNLVAFIYKFAMYDQRKKLERLDGAIRNRPKSNRISLGFL